MLARYGLDAIGEGDIFVSNDPYSANGTHKNDINVISPIFHDGDLVYFSVTKAHWSDIGGKDPGSWSPDATSTFQEGVSIPPHPPLPRRRAERGGPGADPGEHARARGQLRRPDGADRCGRVAERRMHEICPRYGRDTVEACIDSMFEYVEQRVRAEILALPGRDVRGVRDRGVRRRHATTPCTSRRA